MAANSGGKSEVDRNSEDGKSSLILGPLFPHLHLLREFARLHPAVKFAKIRPRNIEPTRDIASYEPSSLAVSPDSGGT